MDTVCATCSYWMGEFDESCGYKLCYRAGHPDKTFCQKWKNDCYGNDYCDQWREDSTVRQFREYNGY